MEERLTRGEAYAEFIALLREERNGLVERFVEGYLRRGEGDLLETSSDVLELQWQIEAAERALASMEHAEKNQTVAEV